MKEVPAEIYDREYYLQDNEGCHEFKKGLDECVHPKFIRALRLAGPLHGKRVLDIGCGRGELLYYCALKGAERVCGVDYSSAAIEIAQSTLQRIPASLGVFTHAFCADFSKHRFKETFDIIFMIDIIEHLTPEQVERGLNAIGNILSPRGQLIITTPNHYYESYLSPLKRFFDIPFKMIKEPSRLLRGKYKGSSKKELWKRIFRVRVDRGEKNRSMHVNVMTPGILRSCLKNFSAKVSCEDPSLNPLSLLLARWWGRELVAVATLRRKS